MMDLLSLNLGEVKPSLNEKVLKQTVRLQKYFLKRFNKNIYDKN